MTQHIRVHVREKPFACNYCEKSSVTCQKGNATNKPTLEGYQRIIDFVTELYNTTTTEAAKPPPPKHYKENNPFICLFCKKKKDFEFNEQNPTYI